MLTPLFQRWDTHPDGYSSFWHESYIGKSTTCHNKLQFSIQILLFRSLHNYNLFLWMTEFQPWTLWKNSSLWGGQMNKIFFSERPHLVDPFTNMFKFFYWPWPQCRQKLSLKMCYVTLALRYISFEKFKTNFVLPTVKEVWKLTWNTIFVCLGDVNSTNTLAPVFWLMSLSCLCMLFIEASDFNSIFCATQASLDEPVFYLKYQSSFSL